MFQVVGQLATVYVVGMVGTFAAFQRYGARTGSLGDGLAPFIHAGLAAFWPVLLAGSVAHGLVDVGTWVARGGARAE